MPNNKKIQQKNTREPGKHGASNAVHTGERGEGKKGDKK